MSQATDIDFDTPLPTTPLPPSKLAHVVLSTQPQTFTTMKEFYKSFLGGKITHENQYIAFISFDDEHHRVAILAVPGVKERDPGRCGLEHIAFTYPSLSALLLSYRSRLALGMEPIWCVNHGVTMSIYYRDPDGNKVEVFVECFGCKEEATSYMCSQAFRRNPVGVEFEPEGLIQRLREGVDERELLERGDVGRRGVESVPGGVLFD